MKNQILKWNWLLWRLFHRGLFSDINSSAKIPNVQRLHKILTRLNVDLIKYLYEHGGKTKTFYSFHADILQLRTEIRRRITEIKTRSSFANESISEGTIFVRDFYVDKDRREYIQFSKHSLGLVNDALDLLRVLEEVTEPNETFLDNHASRRSAKMLLSVERFVLAICQ